MSVMPLLSGIRPDTGAPSPSASFLFKMNSEEGQVPPDGSSFTGSVNGQVLTTTNGTTFWYQALDTNEIPQHGNRRVKNLLDSAIGSGPFSNVTVEGRIGVSVIASSGTLTITIGGVPQVFTPTAIPQPFIAFADVTGSTALAISGTATLSEPMAHLVQISNDIPEPYVQHDATFNAEVNGVRVFNLTNISTVDGNGVATFATGTTITGGGYLPEPAATNQMSFNDLTTWDIGGGAGGCNVTNDGINSLGLEQYTLDADTTTGQHRIFQSAAAPAVAGSAYIIAKNGTGRYVILRRGASAIADYAVFDLQTGTVEEDAGIDEALITDVGDGWYKCELNTSDTNAVVHISLSDTATPGTGRPSFTGANETILVCHVQYESTIFSTSPIITSGSTVTRVAGVLDTGSVIASAFGALLDVTLPSVIASGATISLIGPDATAEDIIRVDASGNVIMDDGGTPVTIGTATLGTRIKVSYGRDGTGRSGSLDGASVVTGDAPGAGHEGDTFQLGAANSVNQSRCIHHDSVLYATRPTNDQLVDLSS